MKFYINVVEFLYDIISVPVFLFHFLGIPFIWAELTSRLLVLLNTSEDLSHGVAIFIFLVSMIHRVFRAMDWGYKYEMPKWLSWFNHDLRNRVLRKNK